MNEYPSVSIIIPNFNGMPFIERCLRSVLEIDYPNLLEIIVVDDGSNDGSAEMLERKFGGDKRLRIIRIGINKGAAYARNIGAKISHGGVLCFIDNDTLIGRSLIKAGVEVLLKEKSVGIVAPRIYDKRARKSFVGHDVNLITGMVVGLKLSDNRKLIKVPAVGANCFLIRRELFFGVGGFDIKMGTPYEDTDLCYRIRSKGYSVMCLRNYVCYHIGYSKSNFLKAFKMLRNKSVFVARHGKLFFIILLPLWAGLYTILAIISLIPQRNVIEKF